MGPTEREAFLKGYTDYRKGQEGRGAMSLAQAPFNPPAGLETAYKMGWDKASKEAIAKAEKAGRRGEGWGHIKVGGILFGIGSAITILSFIYRPNGTFLVAYGAIVVGLINIARGIWKYFSKESAD